MGPFPQPLLLFGKQISKSLSRFPTLSRRRGARAGIPSHCRLEIPGSFRCSSRSGVSWRTMLLQLLSDLEVGPSGPLHFTPVHLMDRIAGSYLPRSPQPGLQESPVQTRWLCRRQGSKSHQVLCLRWRHQGAGTETETGCQSLWLHEQAVCPRFLEFRTMGLCLYSQENCCINPLSTHPGFRMGGLNHYKVKKK